MIVLTKPQSNQRGIETIASPRSWIGWSPPQSNQRGIETPRLYPFSQLLAEGLNRTSVGLKLCTAEGYRLADGRLNRTSVGLKPPRWGEAMEKQ